MRLKTTFLGLIAGTALLAGCDDPLEVDPTFQVPSEEALDTPDEIAGAVRGIYDALQTDGGYDRNMIVFPDMYADNLFVTGTFDTDAQVSDLAVQPTNSAVEGIWSTAYDGINRANNVLAALPEVEGMDEGDAEQYQGEALFLRALNYHNLARWFGGVPLVTTPTLGVTDDVFVAKSTEAQVYARIIEDLQAAVPLLPSSSGEYRATEGAARALLARVYLDQGNYADARDQATEVIESGEYGLVAPYRNLWQVENSPESILAVQYSVNDFNELAFWFYPSFLGGRRGFAPTGDLANTFEDDDERYESTIGTYRLSSGALRRYGAKYFRIATGEDNTYVLRLAEMYLVRAEANARLMVDPATVLDDINPIRERAGLSDLTADDVDDGDASTSVHDELLLAVLDERRLEFALEGHRFFDLRRILGPAGAADFLGISDFRLYFPIPQADLDANTALEQNEGY